MDFSFLLIRQKKDTNMFAGAARSLYKESKKRQEKSHAREHQKSFRAVSPVCGTGNGCVGYFLG